MGSITLIVLLILFNKCVTDVSSPSEILKDSLVVFEKDHIMGGYKGLDNYHHTFLVNTSHDSMSITLHANQPDNIENPSMSLPQFGKNALIITDYSKFFTIPFIKSSYLVDRPDKISEKSFEWSNLKLGPSDAMMVPYSNYFGEGETLFKRGKGVSHFFDLDVLCDYQIDTNRNDYLDIYIKKSFKNISNDTLFNVGIILFVPKEMAQNSCNEKLYNIVSDTVICSENFERENNIFTIDGFAKPAIGQEIRTSKEFLAPNASFDLVYKMKIKSLLESYNIYPMHLISFVSKSKRIWPQSEIVINNKEYTGSVRYIKEIGVAVPTYTLFSISGKNSKIIYLFNDKL